MHTECWWQKASVVDRLFQQPTSFEFIQATRLLRHAPARNRHQGWSKSFEFISSLNLNFPTSEIESLQCQDHKVQMTNLIVGLTGVQGVLPYIYTHKIKQSTRAHREESLHFLGLFNHKLTAQYVDACLNYHLPMRYEVEQENHYLNMLHALSGYSGQQHEQQPIDDYFAEFSGLMQGQNNTHYALSSILSCIFKYQFKINEFIPESFQLDDQQKSGLGALQPVLLGINSFCGETIQQIDEKIEIVIGPLKREDYINFLSEGIHSAKLKQLLQTWCSPTMLVDLRLILDKDELCPAQLGEVHSMGLARGALLMLNPAIHNAETCYSLIGKMS